MPGPRHSSDGLFTRGGVWWIRTDPVTGDRKSTGCRDRESARAVRKERERLAADPAYAAAKTATIGVYADRLLEAKATKRPGTLDMYRTKVGHVLRVLGESYVLAAVTATTYDAFIRTRRAEGAADNTISKELLALDGIVLLAQRDGAWTGLPSALRPMGFSSGYQPRTRSLTRLEAGRLLAAVPPQWRNHVRVALATGARRSELIRVTHDAANQTVRIAGTKTEGSARRVPLVLVTQRAYLDNVTLPLGQWAHMNRDLARAASKAELDPVTPNDLRRTFASWLIEAGVTREEVAAMLGHRGTAMVYRVYGRADAAKEGDQIRRRLGAQATVCPRCNGLGRYSDTVHVLGQGVPRIRRCPCGAVPVGMHRTESSQLQVCVATQATQVCESLG